MYWLMGLLVVLILILITFIFIVYISHESKDSQVIQQREEYQRLMNKYEHVLTQLGHEGYEVRISYSDSCNIQLRKNGESNEN
tara:strand:- start:1255 stop:1503 length:249 start_codon:yes stop_codon:yes gene_type:complete